MDKLKQAFELDIFEEFAELDMTADKHNFSRKNEKKIKRCSPADCNRKVRISPKRIAVIVAVAILMCGASICAYSFYNHSNLTVMEDNDRDMSLFWVDKSDKSDTSQSDCTADYEISNLPFGFKQTETTQSGDLYEIVYSNKKGVTITLDRTPSESYGGSVTDYSYSEEFTDSDGNIRYVYQWDTAKLMVWEYDGYVFEIFVADNGDMSLKELEKLCISPKK
jgi:hypothetical protein